MFSLVLLVLEELHRTSACSMILPFQCAKVRLQCSPPEQRTDSRPSSSFFLGGTELVFVSIPQMIYDRGRLSPSPLPHSRISSTLMRQTHWARSENTDVSSPETEGLPRNLSSNCPRKTWLSSITLSTLSSLSNKDTSLMPSHVLLKQEAVSADLGSSQRSAEIPN